MNVQGYMDGLSMFTSTFFGWSSADVGKSSLSFLPSEFLFPKIGAFVVFSHIAEKCIATLEVHSRNREGRHLKMPFCRYSLCGLCSLTLSRRLNMFYSRYAFQSLDMYTTSIHLSAVM